MTTKEYRGPTLHLCYPEYLTISHTEPRWYAVAPKERTTAQVFIDPPPPLATSFANLIRNPYFTRSPGAFIEREGVFKTIRGIEGYERVIRLNLPNSSTQTRGWFVDGLFQRRHVVNIEISAIEDDWLGGHIWRDFLESIEILGKSFTKDDPSESVVTRKKGIHAKHFGAEDAGVLANVPEDLHYIRRCAFNLVSVTQDDIEDNPEVFMTIERCLKEEMRGLTNREAKMRIRSDRERLRAWLNEYPVAEYPETEPLIGLWGVLLHAEKVFE
jgi:hypothetical protein